LGVFDSIILLSFSQHIHPNIIFSSLLIYRLVYYFIPLIIGFVVYGIYEISQNRRSLALFVDFIKQAGKRIVPVIFGIVSLFWGISSILSYISLDTELNTKWIDLVFSFHVIEYKNAMKIYIGLLFLMLAFGVYKRSNVVYYLGIAALLIEIIISPFMNYPIILTAFLCVLLFFFLPSRKYFNRRSNLINTSGSKTWFIRIFLFVINILIILIFIIQYNSILLFDKKTLDLIVFIMLISTALLVINLYYLIKPAHYKGHESRNEDILLAKKIIKKSSSTISSLSLLGDKMFIFSSNKKAFIMFGVQGRSWISMGDPVGDPDSVNELIWRFKERCDEYDGIPIFYEIKQSYLDHYIEAGLVFLKIGEEGKVKLSEFSTAGKENQGIRYSMNKLSKEGYNFEIIKKEQFENIFDELENISDLWLKYKHVKEKKFSLGYFTKGYLSNFDFAVIKKDGKIIAFCNIWETENKEELRIDLMRYKVDSPHGIMEYLLTNLMLFGKDSNYNYFNLGISPMSGFHYHSLSSKWDKACYYVYKYVENIYNFKGLRLYKEKFKPKWESVYIAIPYSLGMIPHLINIAILSGSGIKGIVSK